MNIQDYRQLLEQKSVKALLTVLIVVLLLIVIVSLTGGPDKSELTQSPQDDLSALPTGIPNNGQPLTADANNTLNNTNVNGEAVVQPWANPTLPESPTIAASDTETPDDSDKERVVIEDEVVNQLMQRQPSAPVTAQAAPAKPAAPKPAPQAPTVSKPAPQVPAASQNAAAKANLGSVASLKQKSGQRYTLQLMAGRNKSVLEALVSQHKLNPAWVYPRTIDGQPWFVLVQGDYVSAKHARDAIKGLASELQTAKPWPKPFGQVQKEIAP